MRQAAACTLATWEVRGPDLAGAFAGTHGLLQYWINLSKVCACIHESHLSTHQGTAMHAQPDMRIPWNNASTAACMHNSIVVLWLLTITLWLTNQRHAILLAPSRHLARLQLQHVLICVIHLLAAALKRVMLLSSTMWGCCCHCPVCVHHAGEYVSYINLADLPPDGSEVNEAAASSS